MTKKQVLGKGISALLSDAEYVGKPTVKVAHKTGFEIEIKKIQANSAQPRTRFDDEALEELALSIKQFGIIQPITVRQIAEDSYQIISGERRFRASQLAGLDTIPAYIRTVQDNDMLAMALAENLQRDDLDAIEIATTFQRLIDECSLTQEQLSEKVGKNRSTVTNYLRLLKLPPEIQFGIINDDISMGHARTLITIDDIQLQVKLYTQIIEKSLSVRETEELVKKYKDGASIPQSKDSKESDEFDTLRADLQKRFNTKVGFSINKNGVGKITIPFTSEVDLERILGLLDKIKE